MQESQLVPGELHVIALRHTPRGNFTGLWPRLGSVVSDLARLSEETTA